MDVDQNNLCVLSLYIILYYGFWKLYLAAKQCVTKHAKYNVREM